MGRAFEHDDRRTALVAQRQQPNDRFAGHFPGDRPGPAGPVQFPVLAVDDDGLPARAAPSVVSVGRIGDIFGRVRMYNLGFAWFTVASVLLSCVWSTGTAGATQLVIFRMVQAVGGALLFCELSRHHHRRLPLLEELGFALGINIMAAIVGGFLGILVGGFLSEAGWRWVFLANVPIGVFGTVWAYLRLKEIGVRVRANIDWLGNIAFAAGLAMLLIGVTYGIEPYGGSLTGWANPFVLEMIFGGLALLVIFVLIEARVKGPMFRLSLFRIKAFTAGNVAQFLGSVVAGRFPVHADDLAPGHLAAPARLQLRQHTPMGRYLHGAVLGRLRSRRPLSGKLSDRYGARPFATPGCC